MNLDQRQRIKKLLEIDFGLNFLLKMNFCQDKNQFNYLLKVFLTAKKTAKATS